MSDFLMMESPWRPASPEEVKGDFGRIAGDICGKEGRARLGRTLSDNRGC